MKRLLLLFLITFSLQSSAKEVTFKERVIQFVEETYRISNASAVVNHVFEVSEQKNLDPTWILAMIAVESGFRQYAKSPANSHGYLQVNLTYHKSKFSSNQEVYNLEKNIDVGTDIWIDCVAKGKTLASASRCYTGGHQHWLSSVKKRQTIFKKMGEI